MAGYPRLFRDLRWLFASAPVREARTQVRLGDAARNRRDWAAAATAYRAALEQRPELDHIWIQLGHALKEQGAIEEAIEAYEEAADRRPELAETYLFLAHLDKQMGLTEAAVRNFLKALHAGERSGSEADEMLRLLGQLGTTDRPGLMRFLGEMLAGLPPRGGEAPVLSELRTIVAGTVAPVATTEQGTRQTLVFDISDLISYYANARLPTGIQRVQIETIEGALARFDDCDVRLCCFIDGRDEWLELPLDRMLTVARLSTAGGDRFEPEWVDAIASLRLFLAFTMPFEFPRGAWLINLGTSWWLQNYFLYVRHAKATRGIRYVPFVHDMIPIMAPEHCVRGLTQDFISWVIAVFDHADHFLVNSKATRSDLIAVADTLGHRLDAGAISVIPLDADFRKPGALELPDRALSRWDVQPGGFVLFVSTIESRKGHLIAFDAWLDLMARHGADAVPQLICVGNRGWLNDLIYERLKDDPALAAKVTMLSRLTDEELALLYRTCLFTLYPSLYEGWGLPVTESLCHGKVPLISDAASLPEAGGDLAVYAPAGSAAALAEAAGKLIFDAAFRGGAEARIAAEFRPRTWSDLARQIADELHGLAERNAGAASRVAPPAAVATVGAWHPLSRNLSTRIWPGMRTGEGFRSDLGWHWPEGTGCRVRPEGGALQIGIDGPHPALRIQFKLVGDHAGLAMFGIECGGQSFEGELEARQERWFAFDIPAADAYHELTVRFLARPMADRVVMTYFLSGFYLHEADDTESRFRLVEAIALGRLDSISAFREG